MMHRQGGAECTIVPILSANGATGLNSLRGILDQLIELSKEQGEVTVGSVNDRIGQRSQGAMLLIPALIELSPVGGIPGVPSLLALIVVIVSVQILLGRRTLWLPDSLACRSLNASTLRSFSERLVHTAERFDRWFHGRLEPLVNRFAVRTLAGICLLLTLTVPPLELIPFASSIPMLIIALIGLAILVNDGLLVVVAIAVAAIAASAGFTQFLA